MTIDINQMAGDIKANMTSLTFYKPRMASFGMSVSITKGSLQLFWTPPLADASSGFAKEGEKRYDYDNQMVSSLSVHDAFRIMGAWAKLLDGTYEDPTAKDEKYKKRLSMMRSDGKLLVLDCVDDKSKTATQSKTLRFSILHQGKAQNYIFRTENGELALFQQMIRHTFTDLQYHKMLYDGVLKSIRQVALNGSGNSSGNGNSGSYSGNGGTQTQKQSTGSTQSAAEFLADIDVDFSSVAQSSSPSPTPAPTDDPSEGSLAGDAPPPPPPPKQEAQVINDPDDLDFGFLE